MNKVILIGRPTSDPEVKYAQTANGPLAIARYTLAVDRKFNREEQSADFIKCVCFGKAGEFAEKYVRKGVKIAVVGRIQTGSYTNNDGQKVYTTDVVVEEHEFAESKGQSNDNAGAGYQNNSRTMTDNDGFMNIPDGIDEELPFT